MSSGRRLYAVREPKPPKPRAKKTDLAVFSDLRQSCSRVKRSDSISSPDAVEGEVGGDFDEVTSPPKSRRKTAGVPRTDVPRNIVRDRSAAILREHSNWQTSLPSFLSRLIRAHESSVTQHQCLLAFKQQQLEVLVQNGWICQEYGCGGNCQVPTQQQQQQQQQLGPVGTRADAINQAGTVLVVDTDVHFQYVLPQGRCGKCGTCQHPHPVDLQCWPATPHRPTAFYTLALMQLAYNEKLSIPGSLTSWCEVIQQQHSYHGCDQQPFKSLFKNFGTALEKYTHCRQRLKDVATFGIPHLSTGLCRCPACWRVMEAIAADACLGIVRLGAAASVQQGRARLYSNEEHLFVPDEDVALHQELRHTVQLQPSRCSQFKAAKLIGRRSDVYDTLGVLAGVCRHEFPVKCINLFTEENFAYYEQLLAVVIREYGVCSPVEEAGLKWFIVDIGCKLKDYWQRLHPEGGPKFAVGPWHVLGHVADCQKLYGARVLEDMGLTFGDAIEHVWAKLRRFNGIVKYMSSAHRADFLHDLLMYEADKMLERFPETLQRMFAKTLTEEAATESAIVNLAEALVDAGIVGLPHERIAGNMDHPQACATLERYVLAVKQTQQASEPAHPTDEPVALVPARQSLNDWHKYQELLEQYYPIDLLYQNMQRASTSSPSDRDPAALDALRLKHLEMANKLAAFERALKLTVRLTDNSISYATLRSERICYHVARCQRQVLDCIAAMRFAATTIKRHTQSGQRCERSRAQRTLQVTKGKLRRIVEELKALVVSARPSDLPPLAWDVDELSADAMESAFTCPWSPWGTGQYVPATRVDEAEYLLAKAKRIQEEYRFLMREATDALEYFKQYGRRCAARVERLREALAEIAMVASDSGLVESIQRQGLVPIEIGSSSVAVQYLQGCIAHLNAFVAKYEALHDAAQLKWSWLHDASVRCGDALVRNGSGCSGVSLADDGMAFSDDSIVDSGSVFGASL